MVDKELKPCPFCGGEAWIYEGNIYWVKCEDCGVEQVWSGTKEKAIKKWNTRTDAPRPEHINLYERLELVNEARKQAILDFVDKLYEHKCSYDLDNYHWFEAIDVDDIDDAVKEFLGEDYDR